jgi:hypothetical protein
MVFLKIINLERKSIFSVYNLDGNLLMVTQSASQSYLKPGNLLISNVVGQCQLSQHEVIPLVANLVHNSSFSQCPDFNNPCY